MRTPELTTGDDEREVAAPSFLRASPRGFGARIGAAISSVTDGEGRTMLEQDTVVLDLPRGGRHRLPASSLRRAVRRMSLGAAAVVLTIGLALLAAVATGLTGAPVGDLVGLPAPSTEAAGPTSVRAAGIGAGPTTAGPTTASDDDVPDLAAEEQTPPAPVEATSPAPADEPAPVAGAETPGVDGSAGRSVLSRRRRGNHVRGQADDVHAAR